MQDFKAAFREQRASYHAKLRRQQTRYDDEKAAIVTWVKDECAQIGVEFFQLLQRNKEALRKQQQGEGDQGNGGHSTAATPSSTTGAAATTGSTQGRGVNTTTSTTTHHDHHHYHQEQQQQEQQEQYYDEQQYQQQYSSSSKRKSRSSKTPTSTIPQRHQHILPEEPEQEQRANTTQQGYSTAYDELLRSSTNSLPRTHSVHPPRSDRQKPSTQSSHPQQQHRSRSAEHHALPHNNTNQQREVSPEIHVRFTPTVPPSPPVPRNLSVSNNPAHAAAVLAAHTLPAAQMKSLLRSSVNTQHSTTAGAEGTTTNKTSEPALLPTSSGISPKPSYANPTVAYTAQRRGQHPGYDTQGAIHPPSSSHDIAAAAGRSHTRTQHRSSSATRSSGDIDSSRSPPRRRTTTTATTTTHHYQQQQREGRSVHEPHQSLTPNRDKTRPKKTPTSTSLLNNSSTDGLSTAAAAAALHSSREKELWRSLQDEEYQDFIKYQQYQREVEKRSFRNI